MMPLAYDVYGWIFLFVMLLLGHLGLGIRGNVDAFLGSGQGTRPVGLGIGQDWNTMGD